MGHASGGNTNGRLVLYICNILSTMSVLASIHYQSLQNSTH
jgi:hypothetical protein